MSPRSTSDDGATAAALRLLVADVYEAAGALRRHGERLAERRGLTQARWQLLSVVSDGEWSVPAAARRLGVSRQAVQRIADDVVADGLARHRDNPAHRRSPFLELTPTGRRALAAVTADAARASGAVAAGLSVEELDRARATLRRIVEQLAATEGRARTSTAQPPRTSTATSS